MKNRATTIATYVAVVSIQVVTATAIAAVYLGMCQIAETIGLAAWTGWLTGGLLLGLAAAVVLAVATASLAAAARQTAYERVFDDDGDDGDEPNEPVGEKTAAMSSPKLFEREEPFEEGYSPRRMSN